MNQFELKKYISSLNKLKKGEYNIQIPDTDNPGLQKLGKTIEGLSNYFKNRLEQSNRLFKISEKVNKGVKLNEIWNYVYNSFNQIIPYDRIGASRLEDEGKNVCLCWQKSNNSVKIETETKIALDTTSLQKIIDSGEPRIINDLEQYLAEHPDSQTTKLIVAEGMKSSLTCPMYAMGRPIGFIFFDSKNKNTYQDSHKEIFKQISTHLSMIVGKSRMMEELKKLDNLKNLFLEIAVHDLKSPINVINHYINIWKQGYYDDYNDQQKKSLDIMEKNCIRMRNLIDDFLDLSAIETGKIKIREKRINLNEVILNYYITNKSLAQNKSITFNLDIPEELPDIMADKDRIIQVIDNYVSNAVKYSPPESKITLGAKLDTNKIVIFVKDQGPGIPQNKMNKLFTKFGKTGIKPTGQEKSTGLGLYICKIIIEKHGGQVGVESKPGQGSIFKFTLPLNELN